MMHENKFILSVKVNNQPLRDNDGTVTLPFSSEFSLFLKNLNSLRAMVTVSIDGTDALDGKRLILPANGSLDLERYIRGGNLNSGNKFKFIERSAAVEAHRGVKADDGIVLAEFFTEKEVGKAGMTVRELADTLGVRAKDIIAHFLMAGKFYTVDYFLDADTVQKAVQYFHLHGSFMPKPYTPPPFSPRWPDNPTYPKYPAPFGGGMYKSAAPRPSFSGNPRGPSASSGRSRSMGPTRSMGQSLGGIRGQSMGMNVNCSTQSFGGEQERGGSLADMAYTTGLNDAGITVPGSQSNQQFHDVQGFPLESQSTVIVLQLRGEVGGVAVANPVTVQHKPTCSTCGKVNKAVNKYCSQCGTALVLI